MTRYNSVLRTAKLSKYFGRLSVLRSVSFEIEQGAFLTIFGRNGAGKTTLLKIVSSLIRSYEGEVFLFGKNLRKNADEIRKRLGFISHDSFLYKDLTVRDNLIFYGRMYGIKEPKTKADALIERVGIEEKALSAVRSLSRGMKQRLSLARVFLHEPDLLLLDEPYTGLDEEASEILDSFFSRFLSEGGTAIMATHNLERAFKHAKSIFVLERGAIVCQTETHKIDLETFRNDYRKMIS